MKKTVLKVSGMGCSGCVSSVESALNSLQGVSDVEVNLDKEIASLSYDESKVQVSDFEKAIEEAGYTMAGVKE